MTTETGAGRRRRRRWRLDGPNGSMAPRSAIEVLVDLNDKVATRQGRASTSRCRSGFTPLDKTIGTGLRAGELLLIGGAQGTGKTTMALQMARNVASGGQANVLYICFEHDELYLLNRLIAAESALAHLPHKTGAIKIQDVRKEILGTWMAEGGGAAQLAANPRLRPSLDRIARYGQNLFLLRGSQTASTVDGMRQLIRQHRELSGDRRLMVVVDYLQKVPVIPEPPTESEKVTYVVNGLKDIALSEDVPMIAIVAADKEGLKAVAPAQLPPARLVGDQLRGRHHPDPQREVPHRRQGQHRVQPVPGAALPRLGHRLGGEEPRRPGRGGPRVREALRVLLLRPQRADGAGEADRGTPLQRLTRAADPAPLAALSPAVLAHAPGRVRSLRSLGLRLAPGAAEPAGRGPRRHDPRLAARPVRRRVRLPTGRPTRGPASPACATRGRRRPSTLVEARRRAAAGEPDARRVRCAGSGHAGLTRIARSRRRPRHAAR